MEVKCDDNAFSPLVLVVDDFQDNREMFAEYLSFSGFRVAEAATGRRRSIAPSSCSRTSS